MGGFYSSPEANSSLEVGNMGASVSKVNAGATAPRMNGMNGRNNVEMANNARVYTNASDPGTPGANNTRRNKNGPNNGSRNHVVLKLNNLREVVVDKPSQLNAGEGLVGNKQVGGRRRKGSRKAHRRGHKSRRR
jgi:hypothetical protein